MLIKVDKVTTGFKNVSNFSLRTCFVIVSLNGWLGLNGRISHSVLMDLLSGKFNSLDYDKGDEIVSNRIVWVINVAVLQSIIIPRNDTLAPWWSLECILSVYEYMAIHVYHSQRGTITMRIIKALI